MLPEDPRYLRVLSALLQGLTGDLPEWEAPWAMCLEDEYRHGGMPHRGDGSAFRGDNLNRLWEAAERAGHDYPTWLTRTEIVAAGGSLAIGARGVTVRIAYGVGGAAIDAGASHAGSIDARQFRDQVVYNVSEIRNLPQQYCRPAWELMSRNKERRIARVEAFFRDLRFDRVHRVDPEDGARARLEMGTARIHMPPWELFNSARDYYVTLAHESVHWVRYVRGEFDESVDTDPLLYHREDMIAEVGAAFLCADLGLSRVPLSNQLLYVNSKRRYLDDPARAVLDVADEAARSVGWLHRLAPGYRVAEDGAYRRTPPGPENDVMQVLDMMREARRFVAATQELRGRTSARDVAWIIEAVRVLDMAERIDLAAGEVRTALEAAAFLSDPGRPDGPVKAGDYIEEARRGLKHDIEQMWADLNRMKRDQAQPSGMRL